jgi:hypothetical protein
MRIVLDENLPRPLKRAFSSVHVVKTVQEWGFAGLTNGALLVELEGNCDVLLTADKNLHYPQNLNGRTLAIVEVSTNRLSQLLPMIDRLVAAAESATPGAYIQVLEEAGNHD